MGNEQFLLNRLANATIDIYASSCVLARCSKSLNEGVESAHHEEMMTKVWCEEAYTRIINNLNERRMLSACPTTRPCQRSPKMSAAKTVQSRADLLECKIFSFFRKAVLDNV